MKREAAVGVTLLLIATLFSGCLGSAGGNYGRSVRVEGITQKYHFADHSGINVHLSGTSNDGHYVSQTTVTDESGHWSFSAVPSGTYTLSLSVLGSYPVFHGFKQQIEVKNSPVFIETPKISYHHEAFIADVATQHSIKFLGFQGPSQGGYGVYWQYTSDRSEADLSRKGYVLSTPGRAGIQVINESSSGYRTGYTLGEILEVPLDGYQESVSISSESVYIAFITRDGLYGKAHVRRSGSGSGTEGSRRIQWVISPSGNTFGF